MKAILLAAGKSTRTFPITITRPKPLLRIGTKTILEHNLDSLSTLADEIIIVVGYKKELIMKFIGKRYKNTKITFVEQKQQKGTGHALLTTQKHIHGSFILLMGDDLYDKKDIKACARHPYALLAAKIKNWHQFGVVVHKNNILTGFVEKPKTFVSDLANTACYKLDGAIFPFLKKVRKSERNEIELPDAIVALSKSSNVKIVTTKNWRPIGFPWDILLADQELRNGRNIIGKNTRIVGSVINSNIGNNCIIKGTVKNSIIMDNAIIGENSIVENSILGEQVHLNGKIKSGKCTSLVKGKEVAVKNFGSAIGDNVKARNVFIQPGIKVWPNRTIRGLITHDVM